MPACNRDHLALLSKTLRIERDDAMPTCTATTASLRLFLSTLQWTTLKFRIGFSSIALLFRSFFCSSFVCIWKHSNGLGDTSAYKSMGALYYNYISPLQGTRGDPFPCVIDRLEDRISGRFLYFPFYLGANHAYSGTWGRYQALSWVRNRHLGRDRSLERAGCISI